MIKVVAFNGSPRKGGNTEMLLERVCGVLEEEGIDTEQVALRTLKFDGCIACMQCFERKDGRCAVKKDDMNACIEKMREADGILLGSPTYFADVSVRVKALMERAGMVARANGDMFRRKVGAAVVAVRRAGGIHTFDSMNHFFLIGQMIVPGSSYWNVGVGRDAGQVQADEEGMQTMTTLGRNMAWLLKKLA